MIKNGAPKQVGGDIMARISFDKKVTRQFKDTCIFNVWDGHGIKADEAFTTYVCHRQRLYFRGSVARNEANQGTCHKCWL